MRSARTALSAAEAREADAELQLRSQLMEGYERVRGLQHTTDLYRRALAKALNSITITLTVTLMLTVSVVARLPSSKLGGCNRCSQL